MTVRSRLLAPALAVLMMPRLLAGAAYAAAPTAAPPPAAPASAAPTPAAPETKLLTDYLDNLKTLRTSFVQTLADPNGREIDRASGTLIVSRPAKFSWSIQPQPPAEAAPPKAPAMTGTGGGQLMVCDGLNLWFYDRDLQQVTVKPVDAALSATPAMLLSGTVDVRKSFTITGAGERAGLDWVLVEPNGADADFRRALFGFEHGELKRMILEDKLDQTATIIFEKIQRNGPVSAGEVSFKPPAGADVIGSPRR
jgi:outer membrane lipoprotein carrier protein